MLKYDEIRPTDLDGETASFAVGDVLGILARDIEDDPERVKLIDSSLAARIAAAT